MAQGLPTALTVHSDDPAFCQQVADVLHGPAFRAYTGDDMLGGRAGRRDERTMLAVATGVADGMGLGLNARAGLITRGLNEMLRLNIAIGGRPETLMGLAGLGDLVLTCTRRPVAQPPPGAWPWDAAPRSRMRCARSAKWWNRSRPPTRSCAKPSAMAWNCRSPATCAMSLHGGITRPKGCAD